jgi:type VI protein secretion system component VasA
LSLFLVELDTETSSYMVNVDMRRRRVFDVFSIKQNVYSTLVHAKTNYVVINLCKTNIHIIKRAATL